MTDYILQQARESYWPHLDLVAPIHSAYAERHGCEYVVERGAEVFHKWGGWDKLPRLIELTGRPDTGWVFWLDADTLAVGDADPRGVMGDALVGMSRHKGRTTPTTLNCGVLFVRACTQTHEWLTEVLARQPGVYPWYEQDIMNELLLEPEWAGLVRDLPHVWNSTGCLGHPQECEIRAWHGGGAHSSRLRAMRAEIERRGL